MLVVGVAGGYFIGGAGGGAQTITVPGPTTTITQPGGGTTTVTTTVTSPPVTTTLTTTVPGAGGGLTGTVQIGCLCPLTGVLGSYGENSESTITLAQTQVNEYLRSLGAAWQLEVVIENTNTDPTLALQKTQEFAARNIRLLVGPQSSAEVRAIKSYIDANNILTISQSSTAPGLRIAGDNVYRFVPDDTIQGPAIARVIAESGTTAIVHVWRGDAWGDGLAASSKDRLSQLGIQTVGEIRYSPEAVEFSAEASDLAAKVEAAANQYGKENVGVLLDAFAEAVVFLQASAQHQILGEVKWFGSDGTANLAELVKDPIAAAFAVKTNWINPIFGPLDSPKVTGITEYVRGDLGRTPDAYAYAAYDVVWVLALAMHQTQSTDPTVIKPAIEPVLGSYFGALGLIVLNEGGDLATSNYQLWVIREIEPGTYDWVPIGVYLSASDTVVISG